MIYTLKNESIEMFNESVKTDFPKYTSQLINWANQNAQGTRPVVVGQMSELFPKFLNSEEEKTIEGWRRWYTERYPNAFDRATEKIYAQVRIPAYPDSETGIIRTLNRSIRTPCQLV